MRSFVKKGTFLSDREGAEPKPWPHFLNNINLCKNNWMAK
jgi:hypothetical protein